MQFWPKVWEGRIFLPTQSNPFSKGHSPKKFITEIFSQGKPWAGSRRGSFPKVLWITNLLPTGSIVPWEIPSLLPCGVEGRFPDRKSRGIFLPFCSHPLLIQALMGRRRDFGVGFKTLLGRVNARETPAPSQHINMVAAVSLVFLIGM